MHPETGSVTQVKVVLGLIDLGSVVIASLAVAAAIGRLLLLARGAEAAGAFWCRAWSGFDGIALGLALRALPRGAAA